MATSGTITGNQINRRPYLSIYWKILEQDIPGNRSKVRLELRLHSPYRTNFSASKSGRLEGQSFTYTGGFSGTGTKTVRTRDVWVGHNSDGSKTATFDGSLTLNIYWRADGVTIGTLSVSGTANLDTIPRRSTIKSISGSQFGSSVTVSADVKSSSFSHKVVYRRPDGSTFTSNGFTFTPSLGDVQYVKNATYANVTITLETYNGSTRIGTDSKTHRLNVPTSVKPSLSSVTAEELNSQVESVMSGTAYVSGMSRARFKFNGASGTYGSTIQTYRLVFQGSTLNGNSSTRDVDVTGTGSLTATASVIDSRGRESDKRTVTLTALDYSPPSISRFDVNRQLIVQTRADVVVGGEVTSLNGRNTADLTVEYRLMDGEWSNGYSRTGLTGTVSEDVTISGLDVTKSYEFKGVLRDKFGNEATSTRQISTAKVLMDFHEDQGVAFGKLHEQGVLDVAGEVFMNGIRFDYAERFDPDLGNSDTIDFWQSIPQGLYFVGPDELDNQPSRYGFMNVMKGSNADYNVIWYVQSNGEIYRKSGNQNENYPWRHVSGIESGSNSNGHWYRFASGLQVCVGVVNVDRSNPDTYQVLPMSFVNTDFAVVLSNSSGGWATIQDSAKLGAGPSNNGGFRIQKMRELNFVENTGININWTAIGGWK